MSAPIDAIEISVSACKLLPVNPFRSILATLMSFLVIWPVCCCTALAEQEQAQRSCCSSAAEVAPGGQDHPDEMPHLCACQDPEPREMAKKIEPPVHAAAPFVPATREFRAANPPVPLQLTEARPMRTCDPPRLLLARYSRWLI